MPKMKLSMMQQQKKKKKKKKEKEKPLSSKTSTPDQMPVRAPAVVPQGLAVKTFEQVISHLSLYLDAHSLSCLISTTRSLWMAPATCARTNNSFWQTVFSRHWHDTESNQWLCAPTEIEEGRCPTAEWRRASGWLTQSFSRSSDWYANCRTRYRYSRAVTSAAMRGARGFFRSKRGDGNPTLRFGHTAFAADSLYLHRRFIRGTRPEPTLRLHVSYTDIKSGLNELCTRLMAAFLQLTKPDTACVCLDEEHRYDWFFPHVLQLGMDALGGAVATEDNGARSFFSNGETSVTCCADGSFGIEIISWDDPCSVVIWGKQLIALLQQDMPAALRAGTVVIAAPRQLQPHRKLPPTIPNPRDWSAGTH